MDLKRIPETAVDQALERARHYRVLNEPNQAESICLDILDVAPDHQEALTTLILALTDQFERRLPERFRRAQELLKQVRGDYQRTYYEGIVCERRARAQLHRNLVAGGAAARHWLDRAMECYEKAAELADEETADPYLRWNTCARLVDSRPELQVRESAMTPGEMMLE